MEGAHSTPLYGEQKISRNISATEIHPEERWVPTQHQAPHLRFLEPGREVPITSGCKNQQGLWLSEVEGFWSPKQFLLKDLSTNLLGLTPSERQSSDSSLKGTRDTWGRSELSGFGVRAGLGSSFLQTKMLAEAIVPFLRPHPTVLARVCHI